MSRQVKSCQGPVTQSGLVQRPQPENCGLIFTKRIDILNRPSKKVQAILADYIKGDMIKHIALKHNVSKSYILKIASDNNQRRRPYTKRPPTDRVLSILADYDAGMKVMVIATEHKVNLSYIWKITSKNNRHRYQKITKNKLSEFTADYRTGMGIKRLAFKYKISTRWAQYIVKNFVD